MLAGQPICVNKLWCLILRFEELKGLWSCLDTVDRAVHYNCTLESPI